MSALREGSSHTPGPPDTTNTRDGMCETQAEVVFPQRSKKPITKRHACPPPHRGLLLSKSTKDHVALTQADCGECFGCLQAHTVGALHKDIGNKERRYFLT